MFEISIVGTGLPDGPFVTLPFFGTVEDADPYSLKFKNTYTRQGITLLYAVGAICDRPRTHRRLRHVRPYHGLL